MRKWVNTEQRSLSGGSKLIEQTLNNIIFLYTIMLCKGHLADHVELKNKCILKKQSFAVSFSRKTLRSKQT